MRDIEVPWYFGFLLVALAFLLIAPLIIVSKYNSGLFSYIKYFIGVIIVALIIIGGSLRYLRRFGPFQVRMHKL